MNRLQAELQRLYLPPAGPQQATLVRALVLDLAGPASWAALSKVWQGVQAELGLPAPAIAVSGLNGHQLWFSLREPVPVVQATSFLAALRRRYLGGVAPERIASSAAGQPANMPPVEAAPGHWAAFLAPDLAALFEDEPWLDLPPSADAQANLLSQLESTKPEDFRRALERLQPAAGSRTGDTQLPAAAGGLEPKQFLLEVMNDSSVDLHLRIEAAKALLPYFEEDPSP